MTFLWSCIAFYGFYYDLVWHFMAFYGILWHFMAFYGILWLFIVLYGRSMVLYGRSMANYLFDWTCIAFSRGHRSKFIWSCLHKIEFILFCKSYESEKKSKT